MTPLSAAQRRRVVCRRARPAGSAGLSLPELLVAAVVLGLLAAIGAFAGHGFLARQRVEVAARELASAIERERDLAIRDGRSRSLPVDGPGGLLAAARVAGGSAAGDALDISHNLPLELRVTANGLLIDGGTVVVAGAGTELRRCLVMALPLGVLRLGRYEGAAGGASAGDCVRDGGA
jgi:prepilin-type N-terminal cleavage/methylation domain-containing protein